MSLSLKQKRIALAIAGRATLTGDIRDYEDALRESPPDTFFRLSEILQECKAQNFLWKLFRDVHPHPWCDMVSYEVTGMFSWYFEHGGLPSPGNRISRWCRRYLELKGVEIPQFMAGIPAQEIPSRENIQNLLDVAECSAATTAPSYSDRAILLYFISEGLLPASEFILNP